jgi:hypothetical protein
MTCFIRRDPSWSAIWALTMFDEWISVSGTLSEDPKSSSS